MNKSWAAIAVFCALASVGLAQTDDKVTTKDGKSQNGKIDSYDFRAIKLSLRAGVSTTVKVEDVESVEFGALPKEYKEAVSAMQAQSWDDAATKFGEVAASKAREVLKQEALWHQGNCYLEGGKNEEAAKALQELLAKFPQSRYLKLTHALVVRALVAAGKGTDAIAFTTAEETRVGAIPDSRQMTDGLKLLRCQAQMRSGQGAQAKADLQTLAGTGGPAADQARVMLGEVLLADKNLAEAEKNFREALKTSKENAVRSAAYNGLGDIGFAKGIESKKPEVLKDALLLYLRTVAQFPPAAGEPTDYYERAIYQAGRCFHSMGQLEKTQDVQARHYGRAKELYRKILGEFRGSALAEEAKRQLDSLEK